MRIAGLCVEGSKILQRNDNKQHSVIPREIMTELTKPSKPNKPTEPKVPAKTQVHTIEISVDDFKCCLWREIIDKYVENIHQSYKNSFIQINYEDAVLKTRQDYDVTETCIFVPVLVENIEYDKQYDLFLNQVELYKIKIKNYEKKLKEYEEKLAIWEEQQKPIEKMRLQRTIKELENKLKDL